MYKIVLLRHGESVWNQENRFTGWTDVGLTEKGLAEAKAAGQLLKQEGFAFDIAFTSVLKRAIKTLWTVLEETGRMWIPVQHSWRLNERHYGALQGLDKAETAAKFGDEQVLVWRRAYAIAPPPLPDNDPRLEADDPRYTDLKPGEFPRTECLKDTVERFLPYWHDTIVPQVKAGKRVVIAAHGNSLRALIKYLDNVSDDDIVNLNIPTAQPLVYELDTNLKPIRNYYLGDQDAIKAAMAAVANQGKARGLKRFPGALLLLFCWICPATVFGSSVDTQRTELKKLQGRIGTLQKELARNEASKSDIAEDLREVESSISAANRKLRELGRSRSGVEAQLSELERQSQQLAGQIGRQQKQLSELLYQQFVHGGNDALHQLISGADPNQSARDRYFLTLLSRQKAELLGRMRETLQQKKQLADAARDKNEELAAIERKQQQERASLLAQQKQRQSLLTKIASRIKAQQKQIGTLKGNEKRLSKLIDGLGRLAIRPRSKPSKKSAPAATPRGGKIARGPDLSNVSGAFAALRGKLQLPVSGNIASRFGSPRGDAATTWKGLFIHASEGSEVHAVAAGTVVFADWLRGFGNLMIIDHGDGFLSVYANNQSLLREAGGEAGAGEVIATVGASGGNEESGLYFELRHKGQPFDPLKWIAVR